MIKSGHEKSWTPSCNPIEPDLSPHCATPWPNVYLGHQLKFSESRFPSLYDWSGKTHLPGILSKLLDTCSECFVN